MSGVVPGEPERLCAQTGFTAVRKAVSFEGLSLSYVDEGEGEAVMLLHGEPTWSYLWRKVIAPLRRAGLRTVAPDLIGFGCSDKVTDVGWYSYDRHTASIRSLVEALGLEGATLVVHDWGGPIGLRVAVELPEAFSRLVILDTGLFTGTQRMSDAWLAFRDFVSRTEDLPVGMLVERACFRPPPAEVVRAYDLPFPTAAAKAGARAFPALIPLTADAPGAQAGRAVLEALRADRRPTLILWAEHDPVLPPATGEAFAKALGKGPPTLIPNAGHFLQEDAGEEIGERIVRWLAAAS